MVHRVEGPDGDELVLVVRVAEEDSAVAAVALPIVGVLVKEGFPFVVVGDLVADEKVVCHFLVPFVACLPVHSLLPFRHGHHAQLTQRPAHLLPSQQRRARDKTSTDFPFGSLARHHPGQTLSARPRPPAFPPDRSGPDVQGRRSSPGRELLDGPAVAVRVTEEDERSPGKLLDRADLDATTNQFSPCLLNALHDHLEIGC